MVAMYLRKGVGKYDGMTTRDWKIFWASVVVANGYWTLRWAVLVALAHELWPRFVRPVLQWFGFS